jgi:hypothetical protein
MSTEVCLKSCLLCCVAPFLDGAVLTQNNGDLWDATYSVLLVTASMGTALPGRWPPKTVQV